MSFFFAKSHRLAAMTVLLSATLAVPAFSQVAALGGVSGVVRDSAGGVIPGATVVVTNSGTGAKHTVTTDSEGFYQVNFLQPGQYEIVLGGGSFGKIDRKNVPVTVGSSVAIDATLPAATVTTDVTVSSDAPLLDTEKTSSSQVVGQEIISNLPVNGRRFDNYVLLTPNVAPDGVSGLIAYRGISSLYNTNLVDGANNNQAFFSEARGRSLGAPYVYPLDAVQEFESSTTGYSVELGGAAGGIINAITKSGTNAFHGDVYEYYRTPGLNALDAVAKAQYKSTGNTFYLAQPVKVQHQFGVSVGGPIIKDKLFFHFTYDGYRKVNPIVYTSTYNAATTNVANLVHLCDGGTTPVVDGTITFPTAIPGISAAQCSAAVGYLQSQLGSFARNVKQDIYFPRLDYQLNSKTHLSASFLFENFIQPNGYNSAVTVNNGGISQNGKNNYHERFLVVNAETVLSARATNVVHFQWARDLETAGTNSGGPQNSLSNLVSYGETSALPRGAFPDEHRWQITDVYSTTLGHHTIKAGFDLNLLHEQIANLFGGDGSFSYGNASQEQNFGNWIQDVYGVNPTPGAGGSAATVRHYTGFSQTVDQLTGIGADDFWNQDVDGFLEDSWKALPNLTITAGLRYDIQLVPNPDQPNTSNAIAYNATSQINPDFKMFQPRVGIAWNVQPGTVVRFGYGIFYGLVSNSAYYTERRENGVYQKQYSLTPASPNVPYAACTVGSTTYCYQNTTGSYASYFPVGGVPIYTPPGPAPINPVTGAPITPTGLAAVPLSTLSIRGLDPSFKNPQSQSADLALEQVLPLNTTLTLSYVGNRGIRLPIYVDTNIDPYAVRNDLSYKYTNAAGVVSNVSVPVYVNRLSGTTGSVLTGFSDVNSWYHSFVASIRKPLSNGVTILANYTWAKAMDGGSVSGVDGTFNGTDAPLIPVQYGGSRTGRGAEYSKSDFDQRSRIVTTVLAKSQFKFSNKLVSYAVNGWEASGTYTAQSGFPITGFINGSVSYLNGGRYGTPGLALNDGGVTNAQTTSTSGSTALIGGNRVPDQIARRNSFKGPGLHNLDMRVSRSFPIRQGITLDLSAEAFNIVNHHNILQINDLYATYAAPVAGSATCPTVGVTATNPNGTQVGCFTPNAAFGSQVTTSGVLNTERQMQFIGKITF